MNSRNHEQEGLRTLSSWVWVRDGLWATPADLGSVWSPGFIWCHLETVWCMGLGMGIV